MGPVVLPQHPGSLEVGVIIDTQLLWDTRTALRNKELFHPRCPQCQTLVLCLNIGVFQETGAVSGAIQEALMGEQAPCLELTTVPAAPGHKAGEAC